MMKNLSSKYYWDLSSKSIKIYLANTTLVNTILVNTIAKKYLIKKQITKLLLYVMETKMIY